jgi:NAD(P)H-hydrate epimerase
MGKAYVNLTGNPGMSKGGTGDLLAGMIGAFLAQGMNPADACVCAVHIHGLAGDAAAKNYSQHAMTPQDMLMEYATVFRDVER